MWGTPAHLDWRILTALQCGLLGVFLVAHIWVVSVTDEPPSIVFDLGFYLFSSTVMFGFILVSFLRCTGDRERKRD